MLLHVSSPMSFKKSKKQEIYKTIQINPNILMYENAQLVKNDPEASKNSK